MTSPSASLIDLVRPGQRVAVADGPGAPRSASKELSAAAAAHGDVSLLLGWVPTPDDDLDVGAFVDVRAFMGGWGLRAHIAAGAVHALPVRLGATPALLQGPLRPDLLVASVVAGTDGFRFGTEVAWMRAAVAAGARIAAVVSGGHPAADAGPPLPPEQITVIGTTDSPPIDVTTSEADDAYRRIGTLVAQWVTAGARVQVGPGPLGAAVTAAIGVPVHIDAGMLIDGVVGLDERGLLLGTPMAAYLSGTQRLYDWADGRRVLHPVEVTHDIGRLSAPGLISVNTALEVDLTGAVNVEGTPRGAIGGIGGHADFATAAARSVGGLSIIATPSMHAGVPTLVSRLSHPVTTPGHDVDVVVTERGCADLRGLDRAERSRALLDLWGGAARYEEQP